MKKKITRPVSILLTLLLLIGTFTALPFTATAAETTDEEVGAELNAYSVIAVGNGDGAYLNGAMWDPTDTSNELTEVSSGVWEKTYKGISKFDEYSIKFVVNSVDENGNNTDDPWKYNFGAAVEEVYPVNTTYDAVFNGQNHKFEVTNDNSTVKVRLDLRSFDFNTKQGAKMSVTVTEASSAYDLWVGSTQVTDANKNDILGDGSGRASFNPSTYTLTLNNPKINSTNTSKGSETNTILWNSTGKLTVTGSYNMTSATADYGISADEGMLEFKGDFTFRGKKTAIYSDNDIVFSSGEISAISEGECGIESFSGKTEIKNDIIKLYSSAKSIAVSYNSITLGDSLKISTPAGGKTGANAILQPKGGYAKEVVIEPVTKYNLWVGSTQVTDANKNDICADGEGRAKYDPSTKTLTLNDPVIDGYYKYYDSFLTKFYSEDDLTIVGKYSQPDDVPSYTYGIDCRGKLTLNGDFIFRATACGIMGAGIDFVSGEIGIYSVSSAVLNRGEEQAITFGSKLTKITAECTYSNSEAFDNRGNFVFEEGMRISEPAGAGIYPNSNGSGQRIALSANASLAEKRVVIEPTYYNLWVGGTRVTSANASDIFGNGGRVRFDPNTNTLKLMNNPTITGTYTAPYTSKTNLIYWDSEDTLRIEGSLYMNSAVSDYGIYASKGSLDLAGNFTIRATNIPIYAKGDITFSSGTIKAISDGYCGIDSFAGNIEVKNDVVKLYAKGNDDAVSFGNCTLGNKMQITTPEGGYIGSGNILQSNGNRAKEVVIEPEFETLGVTSVIVAGSGNGTFLNGADWDPCDTSNSMSQVAVNVWEKTYTDVSASDAYWIKFAVNSVDEDGEATQDPWKYTFGSLSEAVYQTSVMYNAVFGGEKDGFKVPFNHATVRIRLDLSEFNMNTKEGAKLLVFVTEPEDITVYFTDTQDFNDGNGVYVNYLLDGTGIYDQTQMSYYDVDDKGKEIYYAKIPRYDITKMYFDNQSMLSYNPDSAKSTVEITENIADGAWWYALPETNEYGEYYVALVGSEPQAEYTIAGSSTAIFGTQWDINNPLNDMIYDADNNCYFLKYSNVEPEFDVQLKVVKNHDWSNNWPEENYTFDVISKTTVTVKFYPDTGEITVTGKGVSQITDLDVKTVIVAGNGEDDYLNGAGWDPTDTRNQMTEVADGIWEYTTARLPEFDTYQFKFAINSIGEDGSPTTNPWAYNFGFEEEKIYAPFATHNAKFNGANGIFEVDEEGSTVTLQLDLRNFDYATKKGAKVRIDINRPEKYDVKLGNVEVTELNKDNILGDGKASYNPNTKTLYLMDPAIDVSGGDCNAITVFNDDIKIVGSYHMTEAAGLYGVEIEGKAGSLTLLGNFTFLGTDGGIRVAQDVNIDGGKLVVRAADGTGIYSDFGSINIGEDVESVDVEGTDYAMLTIWSDSNINIDSNLTITTPEGGTVGTFDEDSCTIFDGTTPATHVVIAGEVQNTPITEISITNLTLPVEGQVPTNTALGETGYDVNMVNWYDAETDELVTGEFEADHQYYVKIVLWAQEGYVFDSPLAKINGEYAGVFAIDDMDEEKYISVSQFYVAKPGGTVDPDTEITSVALTNVTVPKSGETWDFTATVPESCELLEAVLFDSEGTQINNYDFVPLTAQTYTAEFVLLAQDGYVFGYEDGTMPKFTATVNGEKATALVAFEEFPDDKMCRVRWSFTVEEGGGDEPGVLVDPDTGISVTTDEDVELIVVDITGTDIAGDIVIQGENVDKVYNITLFKDGQEVQPGSKVTVKIPCDNPDAKVYRVEADGSLTDMNAVYQDGYLVFETEHFSEYIVASPAPAPARKIGDVNGDNNVDVLDAAIVQKYAAGKTTLTPEQIYAGDVNGDNNTDVLDAATIQKYAAGKITEFPKKA